MTAKRLCCAALAAAALASCAVVPPPRRAAKQPESRAAPPLRPGAELEGKAFAELPHSSRDYLTRVASAFAAGDAAFLAAQGERDYERRVRPNFDPRQYLALLYRVGGLASDGPYRTERTPVLDPRAVAGLRYTGWEERGPVLEVRARLRLKDGTELPCVLSVLWKLDPPRIVGFEP